MEEIASELQKPVFWFSSVLVALLVNYLYDFIKSDATSLNKKDNENFSLAFIVPAFMFIAILPVEIHWFCGSGFSAEKSGGMTGLFALCCIFLTIICGENNSGKASLILGIIQSVVLATYFILPVVVISLLYDKKPDGESLSDFSKIFYALFVGIGVSMVTLKNIIYALRKFF